MSAKNCKVCGVLCSTPRAKYCDACRPSKHKNRSAIVFGKRFASGKEAKRYGELLGLSEVGRIARLRVQPRYPIAVNGKHVCTYIADFEYFDSSGKRIIEDVKSSWTAKMPVYRLKIKLMEAANNIKVSELIR